MTSPGLPALPPGFRFGVTSAAVQVEGAAYEDGRGPSAWDVFARRPGVIIDGTTPATASDHYHRLDEDMALLGKLGVAGYKFSISWSRVQPTGRGPANAKGLDFYDRLVDSLLERGIEPMATLHHWDIPQALEDDGGWLNRATVEAFTDYAVLVGERLADRVGSWVPVSSPGTYAFLGYEVGSHAPGRELHFEGLPAVHHLLLAHGCATIALRQAGATSVGCANNHSPMWPASDDAADVGATKIFDALWNGTMIDPLLLGRYPALLHPLLEPWIAPTDMATIRQPLDFYGVNYFRPMVIAASDEGDELPFTVRAALGYPTTDFGWAVVPTALREFLVTFRARYRAALPPLYITETGASYATGPDELGVVDDQARIEFLEGHLRAVEEAVRRGVDIRGFYVWSLLDGFEWSEGLSQRFGLVHVDHETQVRTPKRSFEWYSEVIASQPRGDSMPS